LATFSDGQAWRPVDQPAKHQLGQVERPAKTSRTAFISSSVESFI